MTVNKNPALLKNKGRMYIFDEAAAVKDWKELTVVDNVKISNPPNPIEIKTPSGITIFQTLDLDAMVSCDWYHPGDLAKMELLTRGVTTLTSYSGGTQTEDVNIVFRKVSEAFPLPGFNGDKTVVTINSVKSADLATTYTVTTDYTVAVDSDTGISHLVQVSGGAIPLNTDIVVNYTYTPLTSKTLKPDYDGAIVFRHVMIDVFVDQNDLTKYRRFFLPNCTIQTELGQSLLEIGQDNTSPNIVPITFKYAKPDAGSKDPKWYYIDTVNV
jgi:hypothetical protein